MTNQEQRLLQNSTNGPQVKQTDWLVGCLLFLMRLYRLFLSPHMGEACRFTPTCSCYFEDAVLQRGAFTGVCLGGLRLLRCGPWCKGGHDPVPAASQTLSSHSK